MLPSTFTVTRNILAVKRDRETFLCTEEQAQQIEDAVFQKTIRIKLLDKAGKTIFWGDPKEIKEFRDDTRDLKKQISDQENSEQSEYEKKFLSKKKQKSEWTKKQIETMKEDEIEYFIDKARYSLEGAVKKEYV